METNELTNLIHDISIKEIEYYRAKEEREHLESELNIQTNWKTINEENEKEGLPKITNETQRKSYIKLYIEERIREEHTKFLEVENLKRIYENREFVNYPSETEAKPEPCNCKLVDGDELEDVKVEFSWLCGKINNQELGESDAIQDSITRISRFLHMED